MRATQEATKESKRTVAVFKEEDEMTLFEFLKDNELLYNQRLMYYKDPNKTEAIWNKEVPETGGSKAGGLCMARLHIWSLVRVHLISLRQTWLKKNLSFLHTDIVLHHSWKSVFKPAHEATVSRLSHAGPTKEPDQSLVGEPSSVEVISVVRGGGSTEEPLWLSGLSPTPSQNPSNT